MLYTVEIDTAKCIGCGSCSVLAPEIFGFDSNRSVSVIKESADLSDLDILLKCARSCPVSAITVKDSAGKVLC
ncbi:MAG: ferredoxin [Patescibacteria group bacterium]|jgi:ferredoxin